jgi:putative Holliday junction resolvase
LKILGIDHGNVRIGIAISDETGSFARPLSIITHVSRAKDAEEICKLAEAESCAQIVVGIPYDSDGTEGPRARSVLRFVEQLRSVCKLPVMTWDESFSTQDVIATSLQMKKSRSSRRTAIDDKAAAMILQNYLDHNAQYPEDKCDEKA